MEQRSCGAAPTVLRSHHFPVLILQACMQFAGTAIHVGVVSSAHAIADLIACFAGHNCRVHAQVCGTAPYASYFAETPQEFQDATARPRWERGLRQLSHIHRAALQQQQQQQQQQLGVGQQQQRRRGRRQRSSDFPDDGSGDDGDDDSGADMA
jgi:hypothetical protein